MQDKVAVVALALTNVALIVGWVISGTQRVTEELTRERRRAYSELLCCALAVNDGSKRPQDLVEPVERAEFISSREMYESGLIRGLAASAEADKGNWQEARRKFVVAARYESLFNSYTRRKLRRSRIYGRQRLAELPKSAF